MSEQPKQLRPYAFTSENQPARRGRKPSKLKKYIKDIDLSAKDLSMMIKYIMDKTESQLTEIMKDKTRPMMIRLLVRAYLDDMKTGKLMNFGQLMDRAFGQAKQFIDQTNHEGEPNIADMNPVERQALLDQLIEEEKQFEENS
jgi:hypothetical protein